jgi:ribosomal 50S subunit-recycling heat shock protein
MRLDKFLKASLLIKRRTIAHEVITRGKITSATKTLKPSYEVKNGDLITIAFPRKTMTIKVIDGDARIPIYEICGEIENE